ncbi:nucleotidyl transferase AbiEii/AbiGii toxin family protein [Allomuricauda sp. R78024]|uniref:nucleotidyl transferase AbiEii/AbiGii toxin family protein n=1 Tax=Allomuricauda sp. R78024 TaxID=3093867 RepID=UPI0037C93F1D
MIEAITYHPDWIYEVKTKLGRKYDPKLIEKVIYALVFLEQLKVNGLNFIFKGGTALLLATKEPKRFSIDIDIITEHTQSEIESILETISKETIFTHWEDDNNRKHSPDAPIGHFKMYYKSNVDGSVEPILLDILYTPNPYPELMGLPIAHDWIKTTDAITTVKMPTFDSILGDKLTAFAPKTTGILYTKGRPVEIIKQLFDVAFLMDNITDLEMVRNSYTKVVKEEIAFRKLKLSSDNVLEDTQEACYVLSIRDIKSEEFKHLQLGVSNFTNFTLTKFNIEEAITAAAKVAYLSEIIKNTEKTTIEKFDNPLEVKDWLIEEAQFNKLNKLKKSNPEAFFYWYKASLSFAPNDLVFSMNSAILKDKNKVSPKKKSVGSNTFSSKEIKSLNDAIYWQRARDGKFSDNDPLLSIKDKLNSNTKVVISNFSENEKSLILNTINKNISYLNNYKYIGLTEEQAISNKQEILIPLFKLREKLK